MRRVRVQRADDAGRPGRFVLLGSPATPRSYGAGVGVGASAGASVGAGVGVGAGAAIASAPEVCVGSARRIDSSSNLTQWL